MGPIVGKPWETYQPSSIIRWDRGILYGSIEGGELRKTVGNLSGFLDLLDCFVDRNR